VLVCAQFPEINRRNDDYVGVVLRSLGLLAGNVRCISEIDRCSKHPAAADCHCLETQDIRSRFSIRRVIELARGD
jgi:hypothetical protein